MMIREVLFIFSPYFDVLIYYHDTVLKQWEQSGKRVDYKKMIYPANKESAAVIVSPLSMPVSDKDDFARPLQVVHVHKPFFFFFCFSLCLFFSHRF